MATYTLSCLDANHRPITEEKIRELLWVIDHGLSFSVGIPFLGEMGVQSAVCHALGQRHGNQPSCVGPAMHRFMIVLNEASWSSDETRAKGLRRLAVSQLGAARTLDECAFVDKLKKLAITKLLPIALRAVAPLFQDQRGLKLLEAAKRCEAEETYAAAVAAKTAADETAYTTALPDSVTDRLAIYTKAMAAAETGHAAGAAAAAAALADAARYAALMNAALTNAALADMARYTALGNTALADAAAYVALTNAAFADEAVASAMTPYGAKSAGASVAVYPAGYATEYAAAEVAAVANSVAHAVADAAISSAADAATMYATEDPAAIAAADHILSQFAEEVVQLLIQMGTPGSHFLYLTPSNS